MSFFKIPFITNLFKIKEVDGYENLQKRITTKKEYLENILSYFKNLENTFKDIPERIQNFNKNLSNVIVTPEEKNIQDEVNLIGKNILKESKDNLSFLREVIKHLSNHITALNKEITIYEELKRINKDLQEEKEKLKKNKEIFHKVGKKAEDDIKAFIKKVPDTKEIYQNEMLHFELEKIIENPKETFENYINSLNKTNQLIKKYNSKQLLLFNYFPELSSEDGVFLFRLIKMYLQYLEKKNNILSTDINQIKNSNQLETKTKLNELIEISESNKREEKIQRLISYQSELDFNKCNNDQEFKLFSDSINIIKSYISDYLFPNYDYEIEVKNYRMSKIIKKIFNETGEIDSKLIEDFMLLLSEPSVYRGFFIVLSQLRTNSKFLRSKNIIELLGDAFNIITDYSVKNKLFENIKNCIIISQTYYYEDENKKKVYIFEKIKNNVFLKNSRFWRDFIQDMIKKEFERFESVIPDANINIEKNINITKNIMVKLNEVVFSQLLTYASNMKDFELNKKVIIKIIDEFLEKYNYLSKNNQDNIYMIITQGEEDIEKLRSEYDPSLEDELIEYNIKPEEQKIKGNDEKKKEKENKIEENNQKENEIKDNNINNIINEEKKENENNIENEEKKENENNIENEEKKENENNIENKEKKENNIEEEKKKE